MRLAQVINGVVVNIIEVNPGDRPDWADTWPEAAVNAGPGWSYDGQSFTAPAPVARIIPSSVPKLAFIRAARRLTFQGAIVALGQPAAWDAIKAALAAAGGAIEENFQYASNMVRADPDFVTLATALSVPSQSVDAVFKLAAAMDSGAVAADADALEIAAVLA